MKSEQIHSDALTGAKLNATPEIGESVAEFITGLRGITILVGHAMLAFQTFVEQEAIRAEIAYDRSARLHAYRLRKKWKKADVSRLRVYPLSSLGMRRLERLSLTSGVVGRGSVLKYQPLAMRILTMAHHMAEMGKPETSPSARVRLLKATRWWPDFVEALYRGEYESMKQLGERSASQKAEEAAAKCLYISPASVHQICNSVRKNRLPGERESCSLNVRAFEVWKSTGEFPGQP